MEPNRWRELMAWDESLKVGDEIEARFTNCGNAYGFKAKIVKINQNTLRVVSTEPNKPYLNDPKREFIIRRLALNWTSNNGAHPIKKR